MQRVRKARKRDEDYIHVESSDIDLDEDIPLDMDDGYDDETTNESFAHLLLKPNHTKLPLWVCPNRKVYLDTSNSLYEKATEFLTAIAEPISRPQFIHEWKITQSSLYGAVSVGLDPDDIIKNLEKLSKVNLSMEFVAGIKRDTRNCGKVKLVLKNQQFRVEAKSKRTLEEMIQKTNVEDFLVMSDDMMEEEDDIEELPENQIVVTIDGEEAFEEEKEEETIQSRHLVSYAIRKNCATEVKKAANKEYPMIEEYDFHNDSKNRNLHIALSPKTHIRPYQESCLNKMFGNGRARSGIIVLPCGAGKTLVGITACATIKKSCIVVCNTAISALQWRDSFFTFCNVRDEQICVMVKNRYDPLVNPCILITTYSQLTVTAKVSEIRKSHLDEIKQREWGLLILDEVHICPAASFQRIMSEYDAHCKLGLTATLVREDNKILDLDYLIGPKLYEANWMDLTNKGYLSPVRCIEVWCDMHPMYYRQYLVEENYVMMKMLAVMNPEKFKALALLLDIHEKRGDKILVFCDSIYPLRELATLFNKPYLDGSSSEMKRKNTLADFRTSPRCNVVFLSRIGDTSIDLPEATVLIQVEGQEGSRRQEAQRLGRILRPKLAMAPGYVAYFYTLISRDTKEVGNSINRQRYLMAQGYTYKILIDITRDIVVEQIKKETPLYKLYTREYVEESLRHLNLGKETIEGLEKKERSTREDTVEKDLSKRRTVKQKKMARKVKQDAAKYSGETMMSYTEKRIRCVVCCFHCFHSPPLHLPPPSTST